MPGLGEEAAAIDKARGGVTRRDIGNSTVGSDDHACSPSASSSCPAAHRSHRVCRMRRIDEHHRFIGKQLVQPVQPATPGRV